MPRRFWQSVKAGIIWVGVGVGIVAGLIGLAKAFDLTRLEIIVSLGFLGLGILGYSQIRLLGDIHTHLLGNQKHSNNPSGNPSSQWQRGEREQEPPERPTGSGAVGGAVIGGIIGTILAPGVGTFIGGLLGALLGNKIEYDDIQRRRGRRG